MPQRPDRGGEDITGQEGHDHLVIGQLVSDKQSTGSGEPGGELRGHVHDDDAEALGRQPGQESGLGDQELLNDIKDIQAVEQEEQDIDRDHKLQNLSDSFLEPLPADCRGLSPSDFFRALTGDDGAVVPVVGQQKSSHQHHPQGLEQSGTEGNPYVDQRCSLYQGNSQKKHSGQMQKKSGVDC